MREIEKTVSNFVEHQFPEFYREEGPVFILFMQEYYKWLETFYSYAELETADGFEVGDAVVQGNAPGAIEAKTGNFVLIRNTSQDFFKCRIYCQELIPITSSSGSVTYISSISSPSVIFQSRKLLDNKDLDKTADFFLFYFKEKYLKGIQFTSATNKRNLIKAALDLYRSKGNERSVDLLFKLVFGAGADVYYPGDDILKLSDGKWSRPNYLNPNPNRASSPLDDRIVQHPDSFPHRCLAFGQGVGRGDKAENIQRWPIRGLKIHRKRFHLKSLPFKQHPRPPHMERACHQDDPRLST